MTKSLPGLLLAASIAVVLATVPWWNNAVLLQFGINAVQLAVMAQAWNIIGGYTGSPSFGNSTFYGLGTYGTAITMVQFHQSFGLGLGVGALLAVIVALLVGIPILRLRGPYFAIATLGLAATVGAIFANLPIAGENIGLVLPLTRDEPLFYELSLGVLVLVTLTVLFIDRSRFGLGLIAIREDEDAAAVTGVNTTLFKVTALAISAFFTALVGGIHAYWITFVDPSSSFDPRLNVNMVIMAVFGGPGTVLGPVVGAFILSTISEVLASSISTAASLLFGIVIVLAVLFMPKGLVDLGYGFRRLGWRYFTETVRQYRL
jgi:branched-chain amino acid transport system permease protein